MKKALSGYIHHVFAFQTQSRLKYEQTEKKGLKKIFRNTSITLLSLFNEKWFCFKTFFMFDCQTRILHFAIWLLFLFLWFFSGSVGENTAWTKLKSELLYGIHGLWLRVSTFFILTEKKLHEGVVDYSTNRPLRWIPRVFTNNPSYLAYVTERNLVTLSLRFCSRDSPLRLPI